MTPGRHVTKSEAQKALRQMFGPTCRLSVLHKAGLTGVRVLVGADVLFQTFDMAPDVWRRCIRGVLPVWWRETNATA